MRRCVGPKRKARGRVVCRCLGCVAGGQPHQMRTYTRNYASGPTSHPGRYPAPAPRCGGQSRPAHRRQRHGDGRRPLQSVVPTSGTFAAPPSPSSRPTGVSGTWCAAATRSPAATSTARRNPSTSPTAKATPEPTSLLRWWCPPSGTTIIAGVGAGISGAVGSGVGAGSGGAVGDSKPSGSTNPSAPIVW